MRMIVCWLALLLTFLVHAGAQTEPAPGPGKIEVQELPIDTLGNVVRGEDLPYFTVVKAFYRHALEALENGPPGKWLALLKRLNISTESENYRSLKLAIYKAKHELLGRTLDLAPFVGNDAVFVQVQLDFCWENVANLRRIHTEFLDTLTGITGKDVDNVLDAIVRPNVSIGFSGGADDDAQFTCLHSMDDLRFRD